MLKMSMLPTGDLEQMGLRARTVVEERFDLRMVNGDYLYVVAH
jgi:hypothetical protein